MLGTAISSGIGGTHGASPGLHTVTVISTAGNRVIAEVPTGKAPTSIAVLPNGRQAYVSDDGDGTIEILNIAK